jgi:UDP-N-acetylglucosamine 2-epimerase (non-hydrolysing)
MTMLTVHCIIGTRPEAIKMIPVIYALRQAPIFNCRIIATAQHRDMLDQVFDLFGIHSDIDLNVMQPDQTLNTLASRMLVALGDVLIKEKPDMILAQGDTTTVLAAALSAFHHQIPFGHVEAGLRTGNPYSPFPEEMNRVLTSRLTQWHFAPTNIAQQNLLKEGVPSSQIFLTGNTIVDMVRIVSEKNKESPLNLDPSKRLVLVTAHRRENFGAPIREIYKAIRFIADHYKDIQIVYPVHPNPNIHPVAHEMLGDHPRIILSQPLDYISFLNLMKKSALIMSDSGGIQEEAISLGKPVLLLREETERPEGVQLGGVIMVGHDYSTIVEHAQRFLNDTENHTNKFVSPYGDGFAADKIVEILQKHRV